MADKELPEHIEEELENTEWSKPYMDIDELFKYLLEEGVDVKSNNTEKYNTSH